MQHISIAKIKVYQFQPLLKNVLGAILDGILFYPICVLILILEKGLPSNSVMELR